MAATSAAPASNASAAGTSSAQAQQQVASAPFRAGTFRTLNVDGYAPSQVLGTTAVQLTPYTPSPNSYLRGLWIQAVCTGVNSTNTVAYNGDAPFNVYSSVVFQDANQKPIVGPFDGYTLMAVNKFGGYKNLADPRANAVYSASTGTGTSAGTFTFVLYVPVEAVNRSALGALQNKSSSSTFQLQLTVNTTANVYAHAPSTSATLVTTVLEDGWVQPKSASLQGQPYSQSPPQLGTTQYWTRGYYQALNGNIQTQLTQGLGYPIRNFMAINYDVTNTTRASGDTYWPAQTQFLFKGTSFWNVTQTMWKAQMSMDYDYYATTADTANGLENGVYVLPFDKDFTDAPGSELGYGYLPTEQGDQFQILGDFTGNCNMYWVANYMAPAQGPSAIASIQGL